MMTSLINDYHLIHHGHFHGAKKELIDKVISLYPNSVHLCFLGIDTISAVIKVAQKQEIISERLYLNIKHALEHVRDKVANDKDILQNLVDGSYYRTIISLMSEQIGSDAKMIETLYTEVEYDVSTIKLWMRYAVNSAQHLIKNTITNLVKKAVSFSNIIIPSTVFSQYGQVIPLGYLITSYVEGFKRDIERFEKLRDHINISPVGAHWGAGKIINLDHHMFAQQMGFRVNDGFNGIDVLTDREFITEFILAISLCHDRISRIASDLLQLQHPEINMVKLDKEILSQGPYNSNFPKILEIIRNQQAAIYGDLVSITTYSRGITTGLLADIFTASKPAFNSHNTLINSLITLIVVFDSIDVDKQKMKKAAQSSNGNVIDIAEFLIKQNNICCVDAIEIATEIVGYARQKRKKLSMLRLEELQKIDPRISSKIYNVLIVNRSVMQKVNIKNSYLQDIKKYINEYLY